jgi:MFS family permease
MPETRKDRLYRLRWWTLVAIAVSVLTIVLDSTVMNIALPTIQAKLKATASELQWMVNAYTMVLAALMLTTGSLGDRFGRAKLLRIGMVIFGGGSLAAAMVTSPRSLILLRIVMGVGGAIILPSTLAIITNVFPR